MAEPRKGNYAEIYVGGRWRSSAAETGIEVVNPATEEAIAEVPAGTAADVESAVSAARAAFADWSGTSPAARGELLRAMADYLEARSAELADTITAEVGTPRHLSLPLQVAGSLAHFRSHVGMADSFPWEERIANALVVRAPVGVVGAITPWNFPIHQVVNKVAPALLSGCTVILKPSEVAPLTAWAIAEAADAAGLPPGVFNLVSGSGPAVGSALAGHPDVDMLSFTGSTRAGIEIAGRAAASVTRVALEMGGKSANVMLADADLDAALPAAVGGCFMNSGQVCAGLSRVLVPQSQYREIVDRVTLIAAATTVGDPDDAVELGPVVSAAQRDRVRGYIEQGIKEGARLEVGGPIPPKGLVRGYYVRPTVFSDVAPDMTIAREEIFGPVLVVLAYSDEDDAVRVANDSQYGLGGAVWSSDIEHAAGVARRIRTGTISVNQAPRDRATPFGGFKRSGIGRESGRFGVEEYVELQTISLPQSLPA
jgi:aldehyde dehydrogenase (NAD+)